VLAAVTGALVRTFRHGGVLAIPWVALFFGAMGARYERWIRFAAVAVGMQVVIGVAAVLWMSVGR